MIFDNSAVQPRRLVLAVLAGLAVSAVLASAALRTRAQGALEFTPLKKKRTPALPLGLSLEDIRIRLPDGGGEMPALRVTRAVGPAADAGLQAGDVLIELNGKPVVGVTDFWEQAALADWRLHLRGLRDGKTLSFRLNGSAINERPR